MMCRGACALRFRWVSPATGVHRTPASSSPADAASVESSEDTPSPMGRSRRRGGGRDGRRYRARRCQGFEAQGDAPPLLIGKRIKADHEEEQAEGVSEVEGARLEEAVNRVTDNKRQGNPARPCIFDREPGKEGPEQEPAIE